MKSLKNILLSAAIVIGAIFTTGCYRQVPPSTVGVKFSANSGISEKLIKPQVTFVGPMQQLVIYLTSIKNASYVKSSSEGERQGDDSILASTVEGASLPVDITVAWHVDPANVISAFENFGTADLEEIQRTFIRTTTNYAVNVVAGTKSIFDLTSKERAEFGPDVKQVLAPILQEFGITVDDVYVGEVFPNTEITAKVNERVAKRNELEKAGISLQQARIDAQTTLTNAKKQAELNKQLAAQGEKAIALKKQENRRKAIEAWDGNPSQIGDGNIPFTNISLHPPQAASPPKK